MQLTQSIKLALGLTLALQAPALAGSEPQIAAPAASSGGDWCEWLQNKPGLLYKNQENPFLQSFQLGGRFQYQASYIDGEDVNGRDFNDTYDEYRRVRLETKTEFLKYFSAKIGINIVDDERRNDEDLDWGYRDFDEAYFSFDLKKAFGAGPLDALKINYGRFKFNFTEEVHMSSKEIYTLERSAIANKLYATNNRPTGITLDGALGKWSATLGLFSGEDDSEFIGGWNDGLAYYFSGAYAHNEQWRFSLDLVQNAPSGADDFLGYDWASAMNAVYEDGRFGALATLALGKNNDDTPERGGAFHALVIMPWYWLVEDKLQAAAQYQYSGSSQDEGIRTNSRYVRSAHAAGVSTNSGRGDALHTLYAGLNYHICGDNLKIMAGIEYSKLDTPKGDVDALTYSLAFRTFF